VVVRRTQNALHVDVVNGEALMTPGNIPSQSVSVSGGDARVDAVGATFSVSVASGRTTVAVAEGTVRLSALSPADSDSLGAGDTGSRRVGSQVALRAGDRAEVFRVGTDVMVRFSAVASKRTDDSERSRSRSAQPRPDTPTPRGTARTPLER
jgi:ferric-dicitrate binding protein FerR (iron transport regulator)